MRNGWAQWGVCLLVALSELPFHRVLQRAAGTARCVRLPRRRRARRAAKRGPAAGGGGGGSGDEEGDGEDSDDDDDDVDGAPLLPVDDR